MLPLAQTSCSTLVEKLGELADTNKSVDVFRYTIKGMQPVQGPVHSVQTSSDYGC